MDDPLIDVIRLLRPQATLWGGVEAAGRWGASFRQRDDLLFCWVQRGECLLLRSGREAVRLRAGDFALVRSSSAFALASDRDAEPFDSGAAVAATNDPVLRLGAGEDRLVSLRGGRFVFDAANENLLTRLLPSLVHVRADYPSSARIRLLMQMNETESLRPGPGGAFIVARLMEVILVEIVRCETFRPNGEQRGLLAGLGDPVTARALSAMHEAVARDWTVAGLARLALVSRSNFAARFQRVVGMGPIEYLLHWRMALAKDQLRQGRRSLGEIALAVGFQSSSAFSTAFTRAVGCSPSRYQHDAAGSA